MVNKGRISCGRIVNNDRAQILIVALIAVNAVMMGLGTFDFVTDDPALDAVFEKVDLAFLILFTFELFLQFLYHGLRLLIDGWLLFDLVVVALSWSFAEAQIVRAFRIFRTLRLVTRVAVMRNLVKALFSVIPKMSAIAMLLGLIMYIFSVMFTQLFKYMFEDGHLEYDYFSRLDRTFFTLFQLISLDAWTKPAREVVAVYNWAWILFFVYIIIASFIFANLIIAVMCDAITALHEDDKALLHGRGGGYDSEDEEDKLEMQELEEEILAGRVAYSLNGGSRRDLAQGTDSRGSRRRSTMRGTSPHLERQISVLQNQIDETRRMQKHMAATLEYLTQQLQNLPASNR